MFRSLVVFVALLLVGMPTVLAQDNEAQGTTVWSENRAVEGLHEIQDGETLVIRGAMITLDEGILVHPGGKLVLHSNDKSAFLTAGRAIGWNLTVRGELEILGTPSNPVIFNGLGGVASAAGENIIFQGGLDVAGPADVRHARFINYSSGVKVTPNGTLTIRDSEFLSFRGLGLVSIAGPIDASDLTFRYRGASLWTIAAGKANLSDSVFYNASTAVMATGNETYLRNVRMEGAETCLRHTQGILRADGVECIEYLAIGLTVSRPSKGFRMPDSEIRNARITSMQVNATVAVHVNQAPGAVFDGIHIGPVTLQGVLADGTFPTLRNLTFEGIGASYAVAIMNPDAKVPAEKIGTGTPGPQGWLFVGYRASARILDPEGNPAAGAVIQAFYENETMALQKRAGENGLTAAGILPYIQIGPDGVAKIEKYELEAFLPETTAHWTRSDYTPDGEILLIRLVEGADPRPTPGPTPLLVLVILVGVALVAARRRAA